MMISQDPLAQRQLQSKPSYKSKDMTFKCIECGAENSVSNELMVAEIVTCAACQRELEVISVDPLQLVLAPEVEEDWGE